ncbi:rpl19 (chloroplast) [Auxenochlorella protothecoides x Auxenochlorella symbiontica]|uniref:Large ribosomal subunit protein bL19c n=1 Tax=Auxenochlorella protothecoides TaxID=3075 RepID=A0A023HHT8_AUXPR|nr:ribosomal protein L19 [Auxenochlorella protothecoides]AGL10897.1 ribosomal protein L19 [Auxenochlorella protothecoides]AGN72472.1 50S ribosomal protein L19 [Auxenochlorella protothecoides]ARU77478.1 ribosomal protein L19p [Auxenochlorella protothecoides]
MNNFQNIIKKIEYKFSKNQLPEIKVGDFIRLGISIQESGKQRVQPFEGTVIALHKAGLNTTVTVRKILQGIGVERVFPIHASCVTSIHILRRSQVSRAKLYYLRNRIGKATRLKEKFDKLPPIWVAKSS